MASLQKNYPYRKKKEKYQEISDMVLIDACTAGLLRTDKRDL